MELRKFKTILIAIIILLTGGTTYVSSNNKLSKADILNIDLSKQYEVIKVVDGDTFNVKVDGKTLKVRMLGVDTPETVDPRKEVQCFGKEASNKTKELLLKNKVNLKIDSTQDVVDRYNRLLAYVYREDGTFINKYLIENGFAYEYTYKVPYEYQVDFKQYQKDAELNKVGLWSGCSSI